MEQIHKPAKDLFDDKSIRALEWNEHIQRRPEMFIGQLGDGSDPKDGIYTMLMGVLVMAVDEFQIGFGKGFSVEVKDDYAAVRDYGRGIPLKSVVSVTSGMTVGIGTNPKEIAVHPIKVTNALSIDFYVASYRDGECSWAKYSKGNLLEEGLDKTTEENGTFIKFMPDPEVFIDYSFRMEIVEGILKEIARDNKGLLISINGVMIRNTVSSALKSFFNP